MKKIKEASSERKYYIDILRALATVAVVIFHCNSNNNELNQILKILLNWCVPVFIMITGALLLNPQKRLDDASIFKKYLLRILVVIVFWGLFYNIVSNAIIDGFSLNTVLTSIKMVVIADTKYCYQFWYLYMLVGLYLITPILRPWINKSFSKSKVSEVNVCLLLFSVLISIALPQVLNIFNIDGVVWKGAFTAFWSYAVIFVFGYIIDKYGLSKLLRIVFSIVLIAHIIVFSVYIAKGRLDSLEPYYGYESLFTFVFSLLIFDMCKGIKINDKLFKPISIVSKHSFGIYILHVIVIIVLNKVGFSKLIVNPVLYIVVMVVITITICMISSYIIKKIPVLKHII